MANSENLLAPENILIKPTQPIDFKHNLIGGIERAILPIENTSIAERTTLISNHLTTGNFLRFDGAPLAYNIFMK